MSSFKFCLLNKLRIIACAEGYTSNTLLVQLTFFVDKTCYWLKDIQSNIHEEIIALERLKHVPAVERLN